jgi:regulator of protease activity HflC (stomatin/prohibitin superfamily)
MEKQMRAERDRRAAILTAEGEKQAQILTAEGEQQAAVLTAEGARQAAILRAEGEAKAIDTVFKAIHEGRPTRDLLSYEYLQMLPQLAEGDANKVFVVPSEFAQMFGGIGEALARRGDEPSSGGGSSPGDGPRGAGSLGTGSSAGGSPTREG